jgi:phospholipase/lecithinase/hemolysin
VWVQSLAAGLGLAPLVPSLLGGTDYAYGTAESGPTAFNTSIPITDVTGPTGQVAQFSATHSTADPNALYTVWVGSNDLLDILTGEPPSRYAADIAAAVINVDNAISTLAAAGAKNFLLVTVPDLGATPGATANGPAAKAAASALSAGFNSALVNSAINLASLDSLNLSILNTYSLLDALVTDPSMYGFTNVTDPCVTGAVNFIGGTACAATTAAQNQYLFWDMSHPTAAGHAIIGNAAMTVLTPEPTPFSLIAAGLVGIGLAFRLKRA